MRRVRTIACLAVALFFSASPCVADDGPPAVQVATTLEVLPGCGSSFGTLGVTAESIRADAAAELQRLGYAPKRSLREVPTGLQLLINVNGCRLSAGELPQGRGESWALSFGFFVTSEGRLNMFGDTRGAGLYGSGLVAHCCDPDISRAKAREDLRNSINRLIQDAFPKE